MEYPNSFRFQNSQDFDRKDHNELRQAIQRKDRKYVQQLLDNGAQVNGILEAGCTNFAYLTPLHLAVISRCPDLVRMLLDKGADVSAKNWRGETALTMAAKMQNMTVLDLLLSCNSKDCVDDDGLRHLHVACMRNRVDIVREFLLKDHGQSINKAVGQGSMFWSGYTPLHFAVHFEALETVEFLLECGADVTAKDSKQLTPLHLADLQRHEKMIDLILEAHKLELRNPTGSNGLTHFHIACTRNNATIVEHFLQIGVSLFRDTGSSYCKGWRPIHFAIYYECSNVIDLLMMHPNYLKAECLPRLLTSASMLDNQIMQVLSQTQTNTSKYEIYERCNTDPNQLTPLHQACIQDDVDYLKRFLSRGVNAAIDSFAVPIWTGWTPLHIAARYQSQNVTKVLLDHVSNIMVPDAEGRTALHIAFRDRSTDLFKDIAGKVRCPVQNSIDREGLSTFHILCATGRLNLIEDLLISGVDINAQVGSKSAFWSGFTPLHFACQFEQPKVIDFLLNYNADILTTCELNLKPLDVTIYKLCPFDYTYCRKVCFEILMKISTYIRTRYKDFNNHGISVLHALAAVRPVDQDTLKRYLVEHKVDINRRIQFPGSLAYNGCTPLHLALQFSNLEQAVLLLQYGADPCIINDVGDTPLEYTFTHRLPSFQKSCANDRHKIRSLFSVATPIENLKPSHFHIACALGLIDYVKYVLDNITDEELRMNFVNCRNDSGQTPLHSLILEKNVGSNRERITHVLLENGADVDAQNCALQTPLHLLVDHDRVNCHDQPRQEQKSDLDLMRIIVNHGMNVNLKNVFGETLMQSIYRSYRNHPKLRGQTLQPDSSSDDEDDWPNRSDPNNFDICNDKIALILDHGFDINTVDRHGQTFPSLIANDIRNARCPNILRDCAITLRRHVRKLQEIDFDISEINREAIEFYSFDDEEDPDDVIFINECRNEIVLMQSRSTDPYTTLRDILSKSLNEMVSYCQNELLIQTVNSNDFVERFPIYGYLLKFQLKRGQLRRPLLERSRAALFLMTGQILPTECLDEVLQYLSDAHLKNIISC